MNTKETCYDMIKIRKKKSTKTCHVPFQIRKKQKNLSGFLGLPQPCRVRDNPEAS